MWIKRCDENMFADEFAEKLGVKFNNIKLLEEALTHRSFLNEHREVKTNHNERLEFLGDAVLELVVTDFLFREYVNKPEGELTALRAALVNGEMLADVAGKLGVEKYLRMSKGEAMDKGKARRYILANSVEAIIGAIYLDRGYDVAEEFIMKNIVVNVDKVIKEKLYIDPKSLFQERSQEHMQITPSYDVLKEEGPDHDKKFVVGIFIGDELVAKGEGSSKQEAQRNAARAGLKKKNWF